MAVAIRSPMHHPMARIVLLAFLPVGATVSALGCDSSADENGDVVVAVEEQIGAPAWRIVDWQHFPSSVGTFATGFDEFNESCLQVFSGHIFDAAINSIAPDVAHSPPYDDEVADGVAEAGFDSGSSFRRSDWIAPAGLHLAAVIVPGPTAPLGRSTDEENGPIISDAIFPISVDGDLVLANGAPVDLEFDSLYPPIDDTAPAADADGYSHMPLNFGENTAYIPGDVGAYEYSIRVIDATGSGWRVVLPFDVLD
jgi:hypothetical protein